jgi:hemerythrin
MTSDPVDASSSTPLVEDLCMTGDPDMDSQHQRIFQALQRLDESLHGPFPLETLGARLKQLETLSLDHFRAEELFMEQAQYPLFQIHRAEHEFILDRCHDVLDQFSAPDSPPLTQLAEALAALFAQHIQKVDMDYATFLEAEREAACPPSGS